MWNLKKLSLYIDTAFCLVLLPLLFGLLPMDRWIINNQMFVLVLILWYYIVYALFRRMTGNLHELTNRKILGIIITIVLTLLGTYLLTKYQIDYPMRPPRHDFPKRLPSHKPGLLRQAVWFLYVVVITFSTAVGLLMALFHQIMLRQKVEIEKNKAELALYKAQINPHFLFNSLNTLYGMVLVKSDRTESAFMKFIELMKYMYTNASTDKIPFNKEIEYLNHYIELQKMRLPSHCKVQFSYEHDDSESVCITPMILLTFVENAFKYGVSPITPSEIVISVRLFEGRLDFQTHNKKFNSKRDIDRNIKGIGIINCKKRLNLIYPQQFDLNISENDEDFDVKLTIKL